MDIEPRFPKLELLIRVLQWAAYIFTYIVVVFPVASTYWLQTPFTYTASGGARLLTPLETILHRVILTTVPGLLLALGLYVSAQLILVLLAIEENTRSTAEMLQRRRRSDPEPSNQN